MGARLGILAMAALLIGSSGAAAQDVPPPEAVKRPASSENTNAPKENRDLRRATLTFAAAATADWLSTYKLFKTYPTAFREANPMIRPLDRNPGAMVIVGAAIDVASVVAWRRIMRRHPKGAKVGLYVGAAFRAAISTRNVYLYFSRPKYCGPLRTCG